MGRQKGQRDWSGDKRQVELDKDVLLLVYGMCGKET